MGKVLDREINPKLGNGTWFWEDLVSIPAAVLTFPKSLRGWSDSCSGYFLLKQGIVLGDGNVACQASNRITGR